jgi:hypothetical protein
MAIFIRQISDTVDPNVPYDGRNLPADQVKYVPPPVDLTNNPSRLLIAGIQLPQDCVIYITGKKVIAQTQILDGVAVYERILRAPYDLEFEMVLRTPNPNINGSYIFPQDDMLNIWNNVWLKDTVVTIDNTYLNKLVISEMVIEEISPTTIRGSRNLPLRLKGYENIPGLSLIVN